MRTDKGSRFRNLKTDVLIVAFGTISLTSVMLSLIGRPASVKPDLRIEPVVRDFGRLGQNETVACSYRLINESTRTLQIINYSKSCDCSSVKLKKLVLEPGSATDMDVEWKTGKKRGAASTTIELTLAAPEGQIFQSSAQLKCYVVPDYFCHYDDAPFSRDTAATRLVRVQGSRRKDLKVTEAFTNHEAFRCKLDAEKGEVSVNFEPALWHESSAGAYLYIKTNSENEPVALVKLNVRR